MSAEETRKDTLSPEEERLAAEEAGTPGSGPEKSSDSLQAEVDRLRGEVDALKDQALRAQAEMQNVRRRAELDVEKAHKFALERFVRELLPVVDGLEKAVENSVADEAGDERVARIHEGVEMTLNMFVSMLEKFNVQQVNPLGAPFDPQQHEAMSMVDAPDAEPNSVVAVMQKGYMLNDRLVRPAMVVVARPQSEKVDEKA
jgi:molecular chaperone GrpE